MGSAAGHHSIHSHATENSEVSSSESDSSQDEGDDTEEEDNTEKGKGRIETSSDKQEASDGEDKQDSLTPRTPSLVLVNSLANIRTLTPSQTPERKSSQHGESGGRTVLRRTAPRKTPVDHHLPRKSCQLMKHSVTGPGKKHGYLTLALMLGIVTKLPTMSRAG